MRRISCKAELLQALECVCVPRGIKGADLVEEAVAVPGNRNHCMLKLNTAGVQFARGGICYKCVACAG